MNIVLGLEVNSENAQKLRNSLNHLASPECNLWPHVYKHPCMWQTRSKQWWHKVCKSRESELELLQVCHSIWPHRASEVVFNFQRTGGCLGGSAGWVSDSWFWLRSWSHSAWVGAPRRALHWQREACLGFSLSPSLCLSPTHAVSVSLSQKWINKKKILLNDGLTILTYELSLRQNYKLKRYSPV